MIQTCQEESEYGQQEFCRIFGMFCLCPGKANAKHEGAAAIGDECLGDVNGFIINGAGKEAKELPESDERWPRK